MTLRILLFSLALIPIIGFSQLSEKEADILRQELSDRINKLRESKGLKPLIFNDTLRKAAEFHSEYMAKNDVLTHDQKRSKYKTPKKRVLAFDGDDFEIVGENALYSTPQEFPLRRNELVELADEMFNSWKNSPGHYANMTEPEYVFGDLGFKANLKKQIVYATQVFGTKGYVVEGQISDDSFGLVKAPDDCEKVFKEYSNLVLNMGNNVIIEGNEAILYYHDIAHFKNIFSGPNDGIAIDLVSRDQLNCGHPNQLDFSPVYDGILLKPYYSGEMLANNRAESDYRVISKVGDIPDEFLEGDYSPSVILIKNGKACKYLYPAKIPRKDYDLLPIEPIVHDVPTVQLVNEGIARTQIVHYDFKTNHTKTADLPKIHPFNDNIHSVEIKSYSSVEGDSIHNHELHNSRASYIQKHLSSSLGVSADLFTIDAKENWDQMDFQLNYYDRKDLAKLSHDSLKAFLVHRDDSLPWDSLLHNQRRSIAIIHYAENYNDNTETLGEFNLRTAVATGNVSLVNKALYTLYVSREFSSLLLFEPQVVEFIKLHPETVTNYTALLSHNYFFSPYIISDFINFWLKRKDELDEDARSNILHLYTLTGSFLLDNWDVSAERLSNVIHPLRIQEINYSHVHPELVLNLHLTFIQYFGQVNDGPNISKSFYFIADYFQNQSLKKEDDVDLALFFNNWSMYNLTLKHLKPLFEKNELNEDGLFLLAQTMNFTNYSDESGIYVDVHKKAVETNQLRWCEWIQNDFQVKRNFQIKRIFCESCQ